MQPELRKLFPNYPETEQINEFYQAHSRAITTWQLVIDGLLEIYRAAVEPQLPGALHASFHALQHFGRQLALTNGALQFTLHEHPLLTTWEKNLYRRANEKSQRRNHLTQYTLYVETDEASKNDRVYLEPAIGDPLHAMGAKQTTRYRVTEIRSIAKAFDELQRDLHAFAKEIAARPRPFR